MFDKEDPKSKWFHLAIKLIALVVVFKLGVLVGEFKMIKSMVLKGSGQSKMLFRGGAGDNAGYGARFFQSKIGPAMMDRNFFYESSADATVGDQLPAPPPAPGN